MTTQRMFSTIVLSSVLALASAAPAFAHASLVRATPAVDSTVKASPTEVILQFSERLESSFSSIVVRDASGKQIDKADAKLDAKDRKVIHVSLPALEPGEYKVEWKAMSADTHKVNGAFTFVIQP